MSLGYRDPLYMLAFDHRGSFSSGLFGIQGTPDATQRARISQSKGVIFAGFLRALDEGAGPEGLGILVDEEFGTEVARGAKERGIALAMPVEASGRDEFDFEFGAKFGDHIEAFDPDFAKVLVRYNPEAAKALNQRQTARLRELSDWLHERGRRFLFELLVPATDAQLGAVGGDRDRFDREVRPGLVVRTVEACQGSGVEPDIWKIEGLDDPEDCRRVAEKARRDGRDDVGCIVLGRGADPDRVSQWLRAGAAVDGYRGFAIGRTLWWDALVSWRDGDLSQDEAAARISENYRNAIQVYRSASA